MYLQMLEKAIMLLQKYNITEFPIPIDVIEEIIFKEGIKLQITKYLKKAFYYEDSKEKIIYLGHKVKATYQQREYLLHETAHMYHCGNTALLPPLVVDKNESQAEAFAAYFLMPFPVFETWLAKGENNFQLSQRFGVTQDLVEYRRRLSISLIENGYYMHLKNSLETNCSKIYLGGKPYE